MTENHMDRTSREPEVTWTGSHVYWKSRSTGSNVDRKSRLPEPDMTENHVDKKSRGPEPEVTDNHLDRKSRVPEVKGTGSDVDGTGSY